MSYKCTEEYTVKYVIKTPLEMMQLGEKIGNATFPNLVICMDGELGAGKTTLTKGIGKALGIKSVINSPTFTIMKVYDNSKLPLYHLDVYRIENSQSDFELEEYFYQGGVSVIEWYKNIVDLIPENSVYINISINSDTSRLVKITTNNKTFINKLEDEN